MSAAMEIDAVPGALRTAAAGAPVVVLEVTAELALRIARRVEDAPRFAAQLEIAALTQSIDWLNRRLAVWLASLMGAVGGMAMGIVLARVIS